MELKRLKDIPILDVAGRLGLHLKIGKNNPCFNGHGNRTGSLAINQRENYFKCFSCGIGGSTIDLVMEYKRIDTAGAIAWLKDEYGFQEATGEAIKGQGWGKVGQSPRTPQEAPKRVYSDDKKDGETYCEVYAGFLSLLDKDEAKQYLISRGLTEDIATYSNIRTIPKDFDYKELEDAYGIDTLTEAGLYAMGKNGKPYPVFFNNRLIIPYFDTTGNLILTLQGRNIDSADDPKYKFLSGIKTPLYNLRAIVDAEQNDKKIYICEGAIDALSCYAKNLLHPVAMGGVHNKAIYDPDTFNRLGNLNVVIATDRDAAGQTFVREFIKKYKDEFLTMPKVINWDAIAGAKDINDLLKSNVTADSNNKKTFFLPVYEELCSYTNDGVLFGSGVFYSMDEFQSIADLSNEEKQSIHKNKLNGVAG